MQLPAAIAPSPPRLINATFNCFNRCTCYNNHLPLIQPLYLQVCLIVMLPNASIISINKSISNTCKMLRLLSQLIFLIYQLLFLSIHLLKHQIAPLHLLPNLGLIKGNVEVPNVFSISLSFDTSIISFCNFIFYVYNINRTISQAC